MWMNVDSKTIVEMEHISEKNKSSFLMAEPMLELWIRYDDTIGKKDKEKAEEN